ncbi:MAG: RIP metalloprotease RseP [Burkholderiaceae bacterium]|nr:RIP metalloprotease RseP [Burkholderiaceae bacterium]
MLFTLFAFALALGLLITFHELGHYWVARRCGVHVVRFSVGFGKVLLRRTDRNGTEWALSAIPLGGYVKMQDDPPEGASAAQAAMSFNQKPLAQRSAIVAAGPIANLLLAVLLYTGLNLAGSQEPAAILAEPAPATPAAMAGFQAGDQIKAVGGADIQSWSEARWSLLDALTSGGNIDIQVQTATGAVRDRHLTVKAGEISPEQSDLMAAAGLALAAPRPQVTQVMQGGAGEQAGFQEGDVITAIGAIQQPNASQVVAEIQKHPGTELPVILARDGVSVTLNLLPKIETAEDGSKIGRIGVLLGADFPMVTVRYGVLDSIWRGTTRTADTVWLSLKMMGRMVTGDVSLRNVSGPVTIADYAGQTARIGLAAYISFLALISVSIGVLNLLPIPMLDGGHLMYYIMEAVRGKPVPEAWMENGQRIGLALLAALMALAFFNDFSRLFS